jgi:uncharacterized protein
VSRLTSALIGRDGTYFELFEAAAVNLAATCAQLDEMLAEWPEKPELVDAIREKEQEGDRITKAVIARLNQTFVTPIEREDILALTNALDDVVDYAEEVADFLVLYKIEAPMEQAQQLAGILARAGALIAEGMPRLRDFGDLEPSIGAIHRLENEGDRLSREAIASLFDAGIDPMVVIRWKDVFERLEAAIDATERVANVLGDIIIKNR